MATREENIKKINEQLNEQLEKLDDEKLENLDDEQLDLVAGGRGPWIPKSDSRNPNKK